jgi:membrane-bound metal-dependent hydrolase YbcI (DUF457 family)
MALCFAHATAGYLAYETIRPAGRHRPGWLAASVLLANAPDLDFVPGLLLGHPGVYHRGMTHTIAAVLVVAAIAALWGWWRGRPARAVLGTGTWAAVVYGSHLVLDFFTVDVRPPYGARFLWPLSDAYWIAPVTPLHEILIDGSNRVAFLRSVLGPETYHVWVGEIGGLLLVLATVRLLRARATPPAVAVREVAEES